MKKMEKDKVLEIFRELVGDKADKLSASHFPADINDRITSALAKENPEWTDEEIVKNDQIGMNLVDWQRDAAFIVALTLFPERFTDKEIQDEIRALMIHIPAHVKDAEELYLDSKSKKA